MITTVVNFRDVKHLWDPNTRQWAAPDLVYIGRFNKTYNLPETLYANPHRLASEAQRQAVIEAFICDLKAHPIELTGLIGKRLVCWCHPKACHGHVLAKIANGIEWSLSHRNMKTLRILGGGYFASIQGSEYQIHRRKKDH